ncbi:MAG: hypothetical protein SXA11_06285 [Cyanobacteriota bacterium]|nr:hypothetical protein [Cyanobacteriota bacterium]
MSKPIFELADELPTNNMTIKALRALDFVVPGEWDNLVGFENIIKNVTGEDDEELIQQIGDRAVYLYNDKSEGYQRALWMYQTISSSGRALGTAAMANKAGESISFLGFLGNLTPKADKLQTLDLSLKVVTEIVAYCKINGIPGDSIGDFLNSLVDEYSGPSLMRMAALVCFDGLIPLGPDFVEVVLGWIEKLTPEDLEDHEAFNDMREEIPGEDRESKFGFIGESVSSVSGWMKGFVADRDLTPRKVVNSLQNYMDVADDKLDYVAAFLDMTTNYYEHTGVQTLARSLVDRAYAEI